MKNKQINVRLTEDQIDILQRLIQNGTSLHSSVSIKLIIRSELAFCRTEVLQRTRVHFSLCSIRNSTKGSY